MTSPVGEIFEYAVRFGFKASNNEVEYEAALARISLSIAAGAKKILMITNSQLVSCQMEGTSEAREPVMQKYLSKVKIITVGSKLASSSTSTKKRSVMIETLTERSVDTSPATIYTVSQARNGTMTSWHTN